MAEKSQGSVRRVALVGGAVCIGLWFGIDLTPVLSFALLGVGISAMGGALLWPSKATRLKLREAKTQRALPPQSPYS